jgi:uncharacterized membrane protein HdeD (DUF308 family)
MGRNTSRRSADVFVGREWIVLLRGVTAIAFSALAFTGPYMMQTKLVKLFGIYALFHGLISLVGSISGRGQLACVLLGTEGLIGLFAGIFTLRTSLPPPMFAVMLIWLWAIATGFLQIIEAIRLRKEISGDSWLALSGLVTVLFGAILWLSPLLGVIGLGTLIAAFALIWGMLEILLGHDLRAMRRGQARTSAI